MILQGMGGLVEDSNIKVYRGFSYNINAEGNLHSLIKSLLNCQTFVDIMKKCVVSGELLNCNLMLYLENQSGNLKVADLGLAHVMVDEAQLTAHMQQVL